MKNNSSQNTTSDEEKGYPNPLNESAKQALRAAYKQIFPQRLDRVMNTELDIPDGRAQLVILQVIKKWEVETGADYKVDYGNTQEILTKLMRWVLCRRAENNDGVDPRKGIYLWGDIGRGKTLAMLFFSVFTHATRYRAFKVVNCITIEREVAIKGQEAVEPYLTGIWCFNDIGQESPEQRVWGDHFSCMGHILAERYEKKILTLGTSNIPPELLEKRYGKRLGSRLQETFNFIELRGPEDLRQTNNYDANDATYTSRPQ